MTGKELWERYQQYTRDTTEHGRVLGFAGAGICWLFKRDNFTFPVMIYAALFFIVAYFIADVLQSLSGALVLKFFIQHHEKKMWNEKGTIEGEILKPRWVDRPAFFFFIIKCILLLIGFVFIGLYLAGKLLP